MVDHRRERRRLARAGRARDEDDAALLVGHRRHDRRQRQLVDRADVVGDRAQTIAMPPRWWRALMRKRATPGISRERSISCSSVNSCSSVRRAAARAAAARCPPRSARPRPAPAPRCAVDAGQRRAAHLEVQIRAVAPDELLQCLVHVEHAPRIGTPGLRA